MGVWKDVLPIEDGQDVKASTFMPPIDALTQRTDYLLDMLNDLRGRGEFTSVRVPADLSREDTPSVGQVVCVDPATKSYRPALAGMELNDVFKASETAYAVGLLVAKESAYKGTVVVYGLADLADFDVTKLVEEGEKFHTGMYYLSSTQPGRITAYPSGPKVSVGFFGANLLLNGASSGDFALVNPQYGDFEAHSHRTYRMASKPAGEQYVLVPDSVTDLESVKVIGYAPDGHAAYEDGDVMPRLFIEGQWIGPEDVSYTLWLSTADSADVEESTAPSSNWDNVYLHFKESDTGETGMKRLSGYDVPVSIGTHGMVCRLSTTTRNYAVPYSYSGNYDSEIAARTWTVRMPEWGRGWLPNEAVGQTESAPDDAKLAFTIAGTPPRRDDHVTVFVPGKIYQMPDSVPAAGTEFVVGDDTFILVDESNADSATFDGKHPVYIGATPYATWRTLCVGRYDGYAFVDDTANGKVYLAADGASGLDFTQVAVGGGTITRTGGTANAVAFDSDGNSIVAGGVLQLGALNVPVDGSYRIVPRTEPPTVQSVTLSAGDVWEYSLQTGHPGAVFKYAIGMDSALCAHYPPVPVKSASLVVNGVEADSTEFFSDGATFAIEPDTVYWTDPTFGRTPWPKEFVSPDETLDYCDRTRILLHFVTQRVTDSGPVTSLHPADGAPIRITACGTDEVASVGDLQIDVDFAHNVVDDNVEGYKTVKASKNGRLLLGPVVERVVAGPGISVTQKNNQPKGQGTVTISLSDATYSGEFDTVALENAKQEVVGMFPYVRLLGWASDGSNVPSAFTAMFRVPTTITDGVYRVRLYATVFGEADFTSQVPLYAGVGFDYNVLPDFTPISGYGIETAALNLKSDLVKPDASRSVDIQFGVVDNDGESYKYKAFDPILLHNDSTIEDIAGRSTKALGDMFPNDSECSAYLDSHVIGTTILGVRPGYIVAVRFSRKAPSSNRQYTAPLGFINLRWSLVDMDAGVAESVHRKYDSDASDTLGRLREAALSIDLPNLRTADDNRTAIKKIVGELQK